MVKWLSSEVSNLMSWVRLPLSAPLMNHRDSTLGANRLAIIKGSHQKVVAGPTVMSWISFLFVC